MNSYFCDLHIHIGSTQSGKPVKITASRKMTLTNILEEASERKGIDMIGVIDAHVPEVLDELEDLLMQGAAKEIAGGGIHYKMTSLLLGSEVEIKEEGRGEAHFLCYLPTINRMREMTKWLQARCKNVTLSSQRIAATVSELQQVVHSLRGTVVPAHIFTPHKGLYGSCTDRMSEVLDPSLILAVELGLSANSEMADRLPELHDKTFLTNSDAHSLAKIGREYQQIAMLEPSFDEWIKVLKREEGRRVLVNYGLLPQLGKYHQTTCQSCGQQLEQTADARCPHCGFKAVIRGVDERVNELATLPTGSHPNHRPPYVEQIPLEFIPGIGPKLRNKLYESFGTEMNILHRIDDKEMAAVMGEKIAGILASARQGRFRVTTGGAGVYGRLAVDK